MTHHDLPKWYQFLKDNYPDYIKSVEELGRIVREDGPLSGKDLHLIQLAAAAAIRSEGSVQSHVRRALEAGSTKEEIYHALLSLTSTIGFPNVAAALNWTEEELQKY
ncbi:MAG: carboxymuconolactone decarboxylase family protein [Candidatus Cloacimonetes bacterium]|nr:carboxymuconolactone decarboxylase family protein [Candidatus Cloacimonadota bacterium]